MWAWTLLHKHCRVSPVVGQMVVKSAWTLLQTLYWGMRSGRCGLHSSVEGPHCTGGRSCCQQQSCSMMTCWSQPLFKLKLQQVCPEFVSLAVKTCWHENSRPHCTF